MDHHGRAAEGGEAQRWIERLGLQDHPEGGYFRETYRAAESLGTCCLGADYDSPRSVSTAIYFLLRGDQTSALHRIRSDEVWHHYAGGDLTLHLLAADGGYRRLRVGSGTAGEGLPQAVVPAGVWFGATVDDPASYALVGCTVAPGFDFRDFEMARRADLLARHPEHRELIERLTPPAAP